MNVLGSLVELAVEIHPCGRAVVYCHLIFVASAIQEIQRRFHHDVNFHPFYSRWQRDAVSEARTGGLGRIRRQGHAGVSAPQARIDGPLGAFGRLCLGEVVGLDGEITLVRREHCFGSCLAVGLKQPGQVVGCEVVVPTGISNVLLYHHPAPLAASYVIIVFGTEQRVAAEALAGTVGPELSLGVADGSQRVVHRHGAVHLIEVCHSLNGEEDKLLESRATLGLEEPVELQGIGFEAGKLAADALPFARGEVVGAGIEQFGCDAAVQPCARVEQLCGLAGMAVPHNRPAERHRVLLYDRAAVVAPRVPGHIEEKLYLIFHRFEVADVEDP